MSFKSRAFGVMMLGALLAGCDRTSTSVNTPTPGPATVATVQPNSPTTTLTLTTQPAGSTLLVNDAPVNFPRARLRLEKRDGRVTARLYSDDPKEAIEDSYKGNSYYLEMPLDADDTAQVSGMDWRFKAASHERPETQNGIFLNGRKIELIPFDVRVTFLSEGAGMSCQIEGQFLQFTDTDPTVGKPTTVTGRVVAMIEIK